MEVQDLRERCITPGTLTGIYSVGPIIGRGGFATVRSGNLRSNNMPVALKLLNPKSYLKDVVQTRNIFSEIVVMQAVNGIHSPNLLNFVAAHEDTSGTTGLPRLTIVTQLCTGKELFDRIVARTHYNEKDAAITIAKLAVALRQLHARGILHRDIKPENILLATPDDNAEPVIADFGLAKVLTPLPVVPAVPGSGLPTLALEPTSEGDVLVGTPGYLSPEIIEKRSYTPAGDVWALGVIAYVLLCGYPPFYCEDQKQLYALIRTGSFQFFPEEWDPISPAAKDLVSRMLTVDPARRITTDGILDHVWIKTLAPEVVAAAASSGKPAPAAAAAGAGAEPLPSVGPANVHLASAVANMRAFNARRKMRAAARAAMWGARVMHAAASELLRLVRDTSALASSVKPFSTETLAALASALQAAAGDTGAVDAEGFKRAMASCGMTEPEVPATRMFSILDVDGSGRADFRELVGGLTRLAAEPEGALHLVFRLHDTDNNGYLSIEELVHVLQSIGLTPSDTHAAWGGDGEGKASEGKDGGAPESWTDESAEAALNNLFARMDTDKDGRISFDEFRAVLHEPDFQVLGKAILRPTPAPKVKA